MYFKIVDHLDVTFNLTDSSDRPFNKRNNEIINAHLKHSKQLTLSPERPFIKLSLNEKTFKDTNPT